MAWVKIDDQFPDHPKILSIPIEARAEALALQVLGLCYSSRYLTDGALLCGVVARLLEGFVKADLLPSLMVESGLWEQTEHGYVIHDYLSYNPSKKQVLSLRSKRQAAGKQGGMATAQHWSSKKVGVAGRLLGSRPLPLPVPLDTSLPDGSDAVAPQGNSFAAWPPEWDSVKEKIHTLPFLAKHRRWLSDLDWWKTQDEWLASAPKTLDLLLLDAVAYIASEQYVPRSKRALLKKLKNCMDYAGRIAEREKQKGKTP